MSNVISAGRLAIQILPSDLLKFSLNLQTDLLIIYVADDLVSALFRFLFFFYNINTFNIIIMIINITIIVAYMIIIINIFFYGEFGCLCVFSLFKFSLSWENLNQLIFVTRGNHWWRIWVHHLWKRNRVERGPVSRPKCLW